MHVNNSELSMSSSGYGSVNSDLLHMCLTLQRAAANRPPPSLRTHPYGELLGFCTGLHFSWAYAQAITPYPPLTA